LAAILNGLISTRNKTNSDMRPISKTSDQEYLKETVPDLPKVPALTTQDERDYLFWLVKNYIEGTGAVVEIGTWFGASCYALAAGLRDSNTHGKLYCFDRFRYTPGDIKHAAEQGFILDTIPDALSFVQERVTALYPHITLIKTEINHITWNQGPVELLHLDAPKRWSDVVYALGVFGKHLNPGSVIVAQDFCLPRAYAVPLIFYYLRDVLELVHVPTEYSTMATFVVTKPLPTEFLKPEALSVEQATHIMDFWAKRFPSAEQKRLFKLALAFFCYDRGEREMADALVQEAGPNE
jgi:hypothetical protein